MDTGCVEVNHPLMHYKNVVETRLKSSKDLERFVRDFFSIENRQLELATGYDPTGGFHVSVTFVLRENQGPQLLAHLSLGEARALFPKLKSINDLAYLTHKDHMYGACLEVDDQKMDNALGFNTDDFFHYGFMQPVLPLPEALKLCMFYALGANSHLAISDKDNEELEMAEDGNEEPLDSRYLSVGVSYQVTKPVEGCLPGFGTYFSIEL